MLLKTTLRRILLDTTEGLANPLRTPTTSTCTSDTRWSAQPGSFANATPCTGYEPKDQLNGTTSHTTLPFSTRTRGGQQYARDDATRSNIGDMLTSPSTPVESFSHQEWATGSRLHELATGSRVRDDEIDFRFTTGGEQKSVLPQFEVQELCSESRMTQRMAREGLTAMEEEMRSPPLPA